MVPSIDMTHVAHTVGDATKRIVTNHTKLIEVLAKLDPLQIAALKQAYTIHIKQNLEKDLDDKTSGHYREGMLAIARGPLLQDVHCVHKAIKGLGTDEGMLNDVLVGRSNADMRAIIAAYQQTLGKDMVKDVKRDLSLETKDHFNEILKATRNEESSPCDPQDIEQAVNTFHNIAGTKTGSGVKAVSKIMTNRSDGQIRAIAQEYQLRFRTPLDAVIRDRFSGHMKDALLLQLARATDRAKSDAMQLEDAMKGLGTKDELLVQRVVRVHWDRQHLGQVKLAYSHIYKRDLVARVKGETSGNYKKLMEECLI